MPAWWESTRWARREELKRWLEYSWVPVSEEGSFLGANCTRERGAQRVRLDTWCCRWTGPAARAVGVAAPRHWPVALQWSETCARRSRRARKVWFLKS